MFLCIHKTLSVIHVIEGFRGHIQWRIQRVHCRGGVTKSARSAAGGGRGRGIPPPAGGGPGGLPRENFWKMDANGAFWAHFFAEFVSVFFPKIVCNFCLQSSDLYIYVMRENFHLSCRRSYHASDKIVGILLDRSRSHDSVKITVLGVEIRIGRLIEFETGGEQSKMADDELFAMDLSWGFSFCTDF